jgi:FMN reductase
LFSYLTATVVPTAVFAASDDWGAGTENGSSLASRIDRAGAELARLLAGTPAPPTDPAAPAAPTAPAASPDPFADFVPFEQLLR